MRRRFWLIAWRPAGFKQVIFSQNRWFRTRQFWTFWVHDFELPVVLFDKPVNRWGRMETEIWILGNPVLKKWKWMVRQFWAHFLSMISKKFPDLKIFLRNIFCPPGRSKKWNQESGNFQEDQFSKKWKDGYSFFFDRFRALKTDLLHSLVPDGVIYKNTAAANFGTSIQFNKYTISSCRQRLQQPHRRIIHIHF